MGLNDKLKMAATNDVVDNLLAEGNNFTEASPKTRRRWKSVAVRRLREIQLSEQKPEKAIRPKKK